MSDKQPAQAGQVLTAMEAMRIGAKHSEGLSHTREFTEEGFLACVAEIESAVFARVARVPMTEAQMRDAFAVAHPQDHADMQDGSPANAVERIGARNVYRRFERGIHAAERHHGIVGKKGGA